MTPMVKPLSAFAALFRLRFGLIDHRMAWRRFAQRSLWSSRRFSAWFGRTSRRAQLHHNFRHRSPDLLWTGWPVTRLPGSQDGLHLWPRQDQQIMHDGHDLTPAFELRRGAQPGLCPQQGLLVKTIAMLVRVASAVAQGHLWQAGIHLAVPQKPTLARVTGPIRGALTHDADDGHLQVACLGQMQPRPPGHLHGMSGGIVARPSARGFPIGAGVPTLKALAIFARRSTLARGCRCPAVQHPLAFEPQQFVERQALGRQQKGRATVPAIAGHDGTTPKQRGQLMQLGGGHLHAGLLRADALLREHPRPTAGLFWQEDERRELPAIADGLAALWQVRLVDHGAIGRGLRLRTLDTGSVDAQPHPLPLDWPQQIARKDLAQAALVNLSVFKGFIQTTPEPLAPDLCALS